MDVDVLVDTGAICTVLPAEMLRQLSIEPWFERPFRFGDGNMETWPVGVANIGLQGERWPCQVAFAPTDKRLLGALTLETFNLMVDPVKQRLVPAVWQGHI